MWLRLNEIFSIMVVWNGNFCICMDELDIVYKGHSIRFIFYTVATPQN